MFQRLFLPYKYSFQARTVLRGNQEKADTTEAETEARDFTRGEKRQKKERGICALRIISNETN